MLRHHCPVREHPFFTGIAHLGIPSQIMPYFSMSYILYGAIQITGGKAALLLLLTSVRSGQCFGSSSSEPWHRRRRRGTTYDHVSFPDSRRRIDQAHLLSPGSKDA